MNELLVERGRANDGNRFGYHRLIGVVCVQVDTGQECRLTWMSLIKIDWKLFFKFN